MEKEFNCLISENNLNIMEQSPIYHKSNEAYVSGPFWKVMKMVVWIFIKELQTISILYFYNNVNDKTIICLTIIEGFLHAKHDAKYYTCAVSFNLIKEKLQELRTHATALSKVIVFVPHLSQISTNQLANHEQLEGSVVSYASLSLSVTPRNKAVNNWMAELISMTFLPTLQQYWIL